MIYSSVSVPLEVHCTGSLTSWAVLPLGRTCDPTIRKEPPIICKSGNQNFIILKFLTWLCICASDIVPTTCIRLSIGHRIVANVIRWWGNVRPPTLAWLKIGTIEFTVAARQGRRFWAALIWCHGSSTTIAEVTDENFWNRQVSLKLLLLISCSEQ